MTAVTALVEGIRRVRKAPVILVCVFVATLVVSLPLTVLLRESLRASFGNSLAGDEAARAVNYEWWTEYSAQASGFTRSFGISVIGFATVLDNISTLVDRQSRPAALLWLGGAYLVIWLFLAGGIVDRFARDRPTRVHGFFTACGVYFVRFLRLAPVMALTYYILFRYVHGWLLGTFYRRVTADLTVERTAFVWRVVLYTVFGALLVAANVVFDYTKVRAVIEDRRSMIGALAAGFRFVARNARAVFALYFLNALLFVAAIALYALVAPGAAGGILMWLGLVVSEVYLVARLWVKMVFVASEVSLFQQRLAHAGYIASAPVRLPEPPIIERALGLSPKP